VTIGSDRQGPLDLAIRVAAELDALGIAYVVGGSLAAAFVGEPRSTLARRRHIRVADDPPTMLWITSPEDVVLRKLDWFRLGGEASDRQWRDIAGVLKVQRDALDQTYLTATAAEVGLTSLLARAVAAAREED